jgi:hypothetical protein
MSGVAPVRRGQFTRPTGRARVVTAYDVRHAHGIIGVHFAARTRRRGQRARHPRPSACAVVAFLSLAHRHFACAWEGGWRGRRPSRRERHRERS